MATINQIDLTITTSNLSEDGEGPGTQAWVYLAIAGREFCVDSKINDFESGTTKTYRFGSFNNIEFPKFNNPTMLMILQTEDIDLFPVWLRMEPNGENADWHIEEVKLSVNKGEFRFEALTGKTLAGTNESLWLGQNFGKYLFLKRKIER